MNGRGKEIALSVVLVMATFYALWPVGNAALRWWTVLPASLRGDGPLLVILLGASVAVGIAVLKLTRIQVANFTIGGCLAFALLMLFITATMSPDSPVHWILYSVILIGILAGALLEWKLGGESGGSPIGILDLG